MQLHDGRAATEATAKALSKETAPRNAPTERLDTRARSELNEQIDRDQQQSDTANLLDADAPRE